MTLVSAVQPEKENVSILVMQMAALLTAERIALDWTSFSPKAGNLASLNERFVLRDYGSIKVRSDRSHYELRSTFADMKGRFGEIVAKWFAMHRDADMAEVLGLYASLRHHDFHISAEFVFLAQAMEAYHASCGRFGETLEPKAAFAARRSRILSAVDVADSAWLKEKLAFANQKPFRQRLHELLEDAPPQVREIVPNREAFVASVVDNRNAHTHRYGKSSHKKRAPENVALWLLSHQLWHLLELVLLRDLGLEHLSGKIVHSFLDCQIAEPATPETKADTSP